MDKRIKPIPRNGIEPCLLTNFPIKERPFYEKIIERLNDKGITQFTIRDKATVKHFKPLPSHHAIIQDQDEPEQIDRKIFWDELHALRKELEGDDD
jgi:hypothetical protein